MLLCMGEVCPGRKSEQQGKERPMSTPSEEPTIHEQVTRLAELEQENSSLHEELTNARAERAPATEEEGRAKPQTRTRPRRSSRRKVVTKGQGVVTAASAGAGTLL